MSPKVGSTRDTIGKAALALVRWWPPALRRELAKKETMLREAHLDWADDHTHLQQLCRSAGYDKHAVEGDSCGIRSIKELADMLHAKIPSNTQDLPGP
jgi:hypothetical protein